MRTLFTTILGIVLAANFFSEALAAENRSDCNDIQSPIEERECGSQEWTKLDNQLNEIWKKALASTPQAGKADDRRRERPQLIKSQRAWLQYRTEQCTFKGALRGGENLYIDNYARACEIAMTRERISFLKEVADDK